MKENKFNRELVINPKLDDSYLKKSLKIRIAQWNIFAQGFVQADSFQHVTPDDLSIDKREKLFSSEFEYMKADIFCLQEADIHSYLVKLLNCDSVKFQDIFVSKASSPCLLYEKNYGPDGLSIIYDTQKFTVLDSDLTRLDQSANHIALMVAFESKQSPGCKFIVLTTHLKSKIEYAEVRVNQLNMIMETFDKFKEKTGINNVIFCGDFNATPQEPVIKKLPEFNFINVYDEFHSDVKPNPNYYTSWTFRKDESKTNRVSSNRIYKHTKLKECEKSVVIDYVFYLKDSNSSIQPYTITEVPDKSEFGGKGLPSISLFPSDHLSLIVDFVIPLQ